MGIQGATRYDVAVAALTARSPAFLFAILRLKRPDNPFTRQLHVTVVASTIEFTLVGFVTIGTPMDHAAASASVNGILRCGLGGQKLYNGEKETF